MTEKIQPAEKTRTLLSIELKVARRNYEAQPDLLEKRLQLVSLLFEDGSFWEARDLLRPLKNAGQLSPEAMTLLARLETLLGFYTDAEKLHAELEASQADDTFVRIKTNVQQMMVYYQTRQYSKVHSLFKSMESKIQIPMLEQMKSFGDEPPLQINWHGLDAETLPFVITDPLPIIEIEVQGMRIYALIDTGGDNLYLDDQYAAELGIKPVAEAMGQFGGGLEGRIGFAKARKLCLGNVTLDPVPVTILPTQRWSKGFADGKYTIGGVIGTGILKQFLATIDYPASQLVLHPRSTSKSENTPSNIQPDLVQNNTGTHKAGAVEKPAVEIPFVLHQTHFMMARGSLNGFGPLTFFVDSGLDSSASLSAPTQTLQYTGIPIPETHVDENSVGGGGEGLWATGTFIIDSLGLGPLTRYDLKGDYGSMVPETYWRNGFIQDGLISHNFLRHYRWTLDFDQMKYIFIQP